MKFTTFHKALLFVFGLKLFYLIYAALAADVSFFSQELFTLFRRNDSFWYEIIATEGYPTTPPTGWTQLAFPFFPLYPLLVSGFMYLGFSFTVAAFLLSCILLVVWVKLIFKLYETIGSTETKALYFIVLFHVFPFHYFYHTYYTELLCGVLLLISLIAMLQNRLKTMAVGLFLLSMSRPTGIVFAFSIFLMHWINSGLGMKYLYFANWKKVLWFLAAPAGLLAYMIYLHFHCGDALAFSHALKAWGRKSALPWEAFFSQGGWEYQLLSAYSLMLIAMAVFIAVKVPLPWKVFILMGVLFPLLTGNITSYYRYFSAVFLVFVGLESRIKPNQLKFIIPVLFLLNMLTFHYWVVNHGLLAY